MEMKMGMEMEMRGATGKERRGGNLRFLAMFHDERGDQSAGEWRHDALSGVSTMR